jgi:hypothetical protein
MEISVAVGSTLGFLCGFAVGWLAVLMRSPRSERSAARGRADDLGVPPGFWLVLTFGGALLALLSWVTGGR